MGVDIVQVERIERAVGRWGERFLARIFTEHEITYAFECRIPFPRLSARFAAKEALIKALGGEPLALTDIEVLNDGTGRPFLNVRGRAEQLFRERSIGTAHLSLSHEREYSIACVVLEGRS